MSNPAPYAPCEVTLEFGDGAYLFRLQLKQIAELQEKCGAGIGTIFRRVLTGDYYIADLVESIRLGLIGGGLNPVSARRLIENYAEPMPRGILWQHAISILSACIEGYQPTETTQPGEPNAAAETDGSTMPLPSETAPSQDLGSSTPESSPSGNTEP